MCLCLCLCVFFFFILAFSSFKKNVGHPSRFTLLLLLFFNHLSCIGDSVKDRKETNFAKRK